MINTRIYSQYRDKPKAVAWYNIVPSLAGQIADVYEQVRTSYDIDSANTAELDVIGRIVGVDRSFESFVVFNPDTRYGVSRYGAVGARYNSRGSVLSNDVSNAIFRVLIRAKIAKNNSDATLDGTVKALSYITSSSPIQVIDNEDMTFSVSFGKPLNEIERFVFNTFDVVPRPQGVQFLGYTERPSVTRFGAGFTYGDSRSRFNNLLFGA